MREIKYQAWYNGKMYAVNMIIWYSETNIVYGLTDPKLPGSQIHVGMNEAQRREYTGLKDKNGKEIYEGDIVTSHTPFDHWNDNVSLVKYEEGTWNYSYAIQEFTDHPERDWEIIGNIYEHPELLAGTSNEKEQP